MHMAQKPNADLVLPIYNPANGWERAAVSKFEDLQSQSEFQWTLILVDDGSSGQKISEELEFIKSKIPDTKIIRMPQNKGKGAAVREGAKNATSEVLVFTDWDFPFDIKNIEVAALAIKEGADIATGDRGAAFYEKIPWQRVVVSKSLKAMNKLVLRLPVNDSQCGLKAFGAIGKSLLLDGRENGFLFDIELLQKAKSSDAMIAKVDVSPNKDLVLEPLPRKRIFIEFLRFLSINKASLLKNFAYVFFLFYSVWLMWSSFAYDFANKQMLVGAKVWSDFAAHIPMIRSFSLGENWPPQYPLYSGPPIQYHFLYYWFVGKLEALGLNISYALNLPSFIGYFLLLVFLFKLVNKQSKDLRVAYLSVYFFVFQGSLAFLRLFEADGFSNLLNRTQLSAMGPWDGGNILAFWHLNTFTNQRHFTFALGILFAFWFFLRRAEYIKPKLKWAMLILLAVLAGLMPQLHKAVFVAMLVIAASEFIFTSKSRKLIVVGALIALPITFIWPLLGLHLGLNQESLIQWYPGFHLHGETDLLKHLGFWLQNWGLHLLLLPLGFLLANRKLKSLLLPAFVLFLVSVLFRFSSDVLANHKFLNVTLIIIQIFSAVLIVRLWDMGRILPKPLRVLQLVFLLALTIGLSASGMIDHIAQKNENYIQLSDVGQAPLVDYFNEQTPKDAVVLNSSFLYHPASLAGRIIYNGWAYFVVSIGQDWNERLSRMGSIYNFQSKDSLCFLLKFEGIDYITTQDTSTDQNMPKIPVGIWRGEFKPEFSYAGVDVYSRSTICPRN